MSRSSIAPRKSSPCCIGCIIVLIIVIGLTAAVGIYLYKFWKDNMAFVDVASKADPELSIDPEVLMPEQVGEFRRISLDDSLENVPVKYWDSETSGVQVGIYEDPQDNLISVIAMSTEDAQNQRQVGTGPLMTGRGKANSTDMGISIRDPFSGDNNTVITWQKPNWTFMVQTTSTRGMDFVEAFNPGSDVPAGAGATTGTVNNVEATPTPEAVVTPAPSPTPAPTPEPTPAVTPEAAPAVTPDASPTEQADSPAPEPADNVTTSVN